MASQDATETAQNKVYYPLHGESNGGTLLVLGNPKASHVIFLHAGFPDDHQSFLPLATSLAKEHDCLVGIACMPGYDDPDPLSGPKKEGYSFEEVVVALREAVQALLAQSSSQNAKLTYIFHDWGVLFGSIHVNRVLQEGPSLSKRLIPDKLVLLDVLPPPHRDDRALLGDNPPKKSIKAAVSEVAYRVVFAASFALQRYIHTYAAIPVLFGGLTFLKLTGLSPGSERDDKTIQERKPPFALSRLLWMMYPYYNLFNGSLKVVKGMYRLPKLDPKLPILYMYGAEKNVMFHEPTGLKLLEDHGAKKNGSEAVKVDEAGHWLYLHQAKICRDKITQFIFGKSQ